MKKRLLSLMLAVVMVALAIPTLALPLFATVEKDGAKVKETFNLTTDYTLDVGSISSKDTTIKKLYKWYFADGTPVVGESTGAQVMDDNCYATYNPDLIAEGVFAATDSYETILEKYAAYLKDLGDVVFNGNWKFATVTTGGEFIPIEERLLAVTQSIYSVRLNSAGNYIVEDIWYEENQRLVSKDVGDAFIDASIAKSLECVQVGEDGKIFLSEIKGDVLGASFIASSNNYGSSVWHDGGYFWADRMGAFHLNGSANARTAHASAPAYVYTIPAKVDGSIKLSFADIFWSSASASNSTATQFCITKNGEAVWPADAVLGDGSTYFAISGPKAKASIAAGELTRINTALAELSLTAKTGDQIAIVFGHGGNAFVQASPAIEFEEKVAVTFQDKNGEELVSYAVAAGTATPKAPYNPGEAGFLINGVAGELPATVTEDIVVKYAGDYVVTAATVDKVSISVSSDFALNLFVTPDAYATRVGIATAENDYYGVAQEDGTYKISVPGFAAKEMGNTQKLWLFQEYDDGATVDNKGAYELIPNDILAAYADSDATAAEKAVAAAALDYTAAAKAYFAGEALAADVKTRLAAQDAAIAALSSDVELADGEDLCVNGMTLVLKDQVTFKVRVGSSIYAPIEDDALEYVVVVEGNGTENEYTGFVYTEGDEEYSITMTLGAVAAADFDTTYKITVKDADGFAVAEVFEYSVHDYIARTFDANAKEADLLRAIYALGVAANNA
ncbi:MAG: hypothetical protein IJ009_05735 [Clostridia bacterium]|nr:hypothetical protein [Clostridia bacterium]